ncbi:MAG: hypothetical protein U0746_08855 [Gemmataceae bacterium]
MAIESWDADNTNPVVTVQAVTVVAITHEVITVPSLPLAANIRIFSQTEKETIGHRQAT